MHSRASRGLPSCDRSNQECSGQRQLAHQHTPYMMQHATCNMQPHKAVTSVAMQCSATQRALVGTLPSVGCAPPKPVELDGWSAGGAADGSGRSNIARTSVKRFQKYLCSQSKQTNKQTNRQTNKQRRALLSTVMNSTVRCAALHWQSDHAALLRPHYFRPPTVRPKQNTNSAPQPSFLTHVPDGLSAPLSGKLGAMAGSSAQYTVWRRAILSARTMAVVSGSDALLRRRRSAQRTR